MSTRAQIIYALESASEPLDAHSVYTRTAIGEKTSCNNGLHWLFTEGYVERDNIKGVFRYALAKDIELPDYMLRDLTELRAAGMPVNEDRHIGQSRAEYTSKSKVKKTRSVTTTVTDTHEVEHVTQEPSVIAQDKNEPLAIVETPAVVEVLPAPAKAVVAPDPISAKLEAQAGLLQRVTDKRDRYQSQVDCLYLLMDLTAGGTRLADLLTDYVEMLESCGAPEEDQIQSNIEDAEQFARAALAMRDGVFARAAKQLDEWGTVCADCTEKNDDEHARDARESAELVTMFGGKPSTKRG